MRTIFRLRKRREVEKRITLNEITLFPTSEKYEKQCKKIVEHYSVSRESIQ